MLLYQDRSPGPAPPGQRGRLLPAMQALALEAVILMVKTMGLGASLVVQWLRVRLPMPGTQVRSLVWDDPTCRGAAKPVHHNY